MKDENFQGILKGLQEARAHARGEDVPVLQVHVPKQVDVTAIRARSRLSQERFAARIGVPVGTLRGWEQGRREPKGAARVLLALLERKPDLVEEILGE